MFLFIFQCSGVLVVGRRFRCSDVSAGFLELPDGVRVVVGCVTITGGVDEAAAASARFFFVLCEVK